MLPQSLHGGEVPLSRAQEFLRRILVMLLNKMTEIMFGINLPSQVT